jgi:hypothetical protein
MGSITKQEQVQMTEQQKARLADLIDDLAAITWAQGHLRDPDHKAEQVEAIALALAEEFDLRVAHLPE